MLVFLAVSAGSKSLADPLRPTLDDATALKISQAVVGQALSGHHFRDRSHRPVNLSGFRGKPVVLSLIYTSCHHTCPMLTKHLERVVKVARDALGEDSFVVLTVGFDARFDTPERMGMYASRQGIHLPGWRFLSADAATIDALTEEVGFTYIASPKGFDHLAQTTVLDADGRVYRQVYGENFEPPALVEPLKQLVFGTKADATSVSGWVNGLRLFCTIYDPSSGAYRFDYSVFVGAGIGMLSLGAIAVFLVKGWREGRPRGRTA